MKKNEDFNSVVGKDGEITSATKNIRQEASIRTGKRKKKITLSDIFLSKGMVIFVLLVVIALVITLLVVKISADSIYKNKETFISQKGTVYDTVDVQAPLVASESENVTSTVSANVTNVYYKQGQTVRGGDKLLELDTTSVKNEVNKLNEALKDMENMEALYAAKNNNLTVKAQVDSYITNFKVKKGSNVKAGDIIGGYIPTTTFTATYNVVYDQTKKIEQWQRVNVIYDGKTENGVVYSIVGNLVEGQTIKVGVYITNSKTNLSGKLANAEFITANGIVKPIAGANVDVVNEIPIYAPETGVINSIYASLDKPIKSGEIIFSIKNDDILAKKNSYTNDIAQLKNQINYYNTQELKRYSIYAETGGIVQTPALKVGDSVVANTQIVLIQTENKIKAEVTVDNSNADSIYTGQKVIIYVNGNGKEKAVTGLVTKKAPVTDMNNLEQDYLIEITVDEEACSPDIIGKNAKIGIIKSQKENAIYVKTNLVYGNTIYVVNAKNEIEERTVQVGIQNSNYTEILSGLAQNEKIISK